MLLKILLESVLSIFEDFYKTNFKNSKIYFGL